MITRKVIRYLVYTFIAFIVLFAFVLAVHWWGWDWTGFTRYTGPELRPNQQYRPEKTFWDWMQLLLVPLLLAIGGFWLNRIQKSREEKTTKKRYEQDQQLALDKQRADSLQTYFDRMSELLLNKNLRSSAVDAEVRNVARAQTITVLTQLDARRVGYVFLREAKLMATTPNDDMVSLNQADLRTVNWSQAILRDANLSRANLSGANLIGADLIEADLRESNLRKATLHEADLSGATLRGADLREANLIESNLMDADLSNADLRGARLHRAKLGKANLSGANLSKADFVSADHNRKEIFFPPPTLAKPSSGKPSSAKPGLLEPTSAEPTSAEPTSAEPTSGEPTSTEPT